MNALTALLMAPVLAVVPLVDPVPDPADVKPGLTAALVVGGLILVTILLWLSMRKQLGKIRFPEEPDDGDAAERPGAAGTENGSGPR